MVFHPPSECHPHIRKVEPVFSVALTPVVYEKPLRKMNTPATCTLLREKCASICNSYIFQIRSVSFTYFIDLGVLYYIYELTVVKRQTISMLLHRVRSYFP
jgi:hypothetical protein